MPITVITGRAGSGKTAYLCDTLLNILQRNKNYEKRTKIHRDVFINFPISKKIEEKFKGQIKYWKTVDQLVQLEECDIFIDELLYYFDAQLWKETGQNTKRFIAIHRHLGVEIYATSQDFAQVDISFRRLTDKLFYLSKIASSREPSATKPPIKWIWGCSFVYTINPVDYKEDQKENKTHIDWPWPFFWINRELTEVYDTKQKFENIPLSPYKHLVRHCEDPNCTLVGKHGKIIHI
jgi:hypothetical protein